MSYIDTLNSFNAKYNVQIDSTALSASITNLLTTVKSNEERDNLIRSFIVRDFRGVARNSRDAKTRNYIAGATGMPETGVKEMLDEYIELIKQAASDASDRLVKDAEQAAIDAAEDLEKAKAAEKAALEQYNKTPDDATRKAYEAAKMKVDAKSKKEVFTFEPYAQVDPYFGMSSKQAEKLMRDQFNNLSYIDARRAQIEARGVKNPMFINEVTSHPTVDYKNATADQKRSLQGIYNTKTIMEQKVNEKGLKAWFWRLFHGSHVKAMNNYIKEANTLLGNSGFDADAISDAENMAKQSFGYKGEEIEAAVNEYKVTLAKADEREANREAAKKELEAKEAALKKEIEDINAKPIHERMFDIRFRPSIADAEFKADMQVFNAIAMREAKENTVNTKEISPEAKAIFKLNMTKLREVRNYPGRAKADEAKLAEIKEALEAKFREMEDPFIADEKYKDYKGMTRDEFLALPEKKMREPIEMKDPGAVNEQIQPKQDEKDLTHNVPTKDVL